MRQINLTIFFHEMKSQCYTKNLIFSWNQNSISIHEEFALLLVFLTKNSWKQRYYKRRYETVNFTNYFLCESKLIDNEKIKLIWQFFSVTLNQIEWKNNSTFFSSNQIKRNERTKQNTIFRETNRKNQENGEFNLTIFFVISSYFCFVYSLRFT